MSKKKTEDKKLSDEPETKIDDTTVDTPPASEPEVLDDTPGESMVPFGQSDTNQSELPKLSDAELKNHVNEINRRVEKNVFKAAINVGNYVLEHFFNNNLEEAMSRNPSKAVSFRKLDKYDLHINFRQLSLMVRIAAQEKFLLENLGEPDLKQLSYSHRQELLRYDGDAKIEIAKKCIDQKLSIRDMREVDSNRREKGELEFDPFNRIISNILDTFEDDNLAEQDLEKLSLSKARKLKSHIDGFIEKVDAARARIDVIKAKIDPVVAAKEEAKMKAEKDAKSTERSKRGRPRKNAIQA